MNNILKIERALVFAKELNLNDEQVKELMAMVLGLVNLKLNTYPWTLPNTPTWPGTSPTYPGDTIISYGTVSSSSDSISEMHKLHDH